MDNDTKRKYADTFQELFKVNSHDKVSINDICEKYGKPFICFFIGITAKADSLFH